ncbi:unnamed protein product [Oppiella nova]|uniref:Replication factor A C-terminal domain-containing protein n=1 Tax=Oppiella nova TaxID=334625 RepID=A0A7R9LMJ4_9ACAR|nr:unnamed protein product [Oppiella nova]CAG2165033.1 unnamed protein product [Oppiella nova]
MSGNQFTMSLVAFKSKIEEAVVLVPEMSAEEKLKAVQFWNVVSERLQEIVNNSAADINALAMRLEQEDHHPQGQPPPLQQSISQPIPQQPLQNHQQPSQSSAVLMDSNSMCGQTITTDGSSSGDNHEIYLQIDHRNHQTISDNSMISNHMSSSHEFQPSVVTTAEDVDEVIGEHLASVITTYSNNNGADKASQQLLIALAKHPEESQDILAEVRLTLWRREAEEFAGCTGQVMAIKNAIVGDFRGRTLSCAPNATLELDPDLPEAHILKGWYERELALGGAGNLKSVQPLSKASGDAANGANEYRFLAQINEQSVPQDGQSLYYNCKGTVVATNRADRHLYKSCGNNGCSKKVREENGFYFCDKCGHNGHQFQWRLMLSVLVSDATGDQWVTAFHEVAEKLIGRPVAELSALYESSVDEYQALVSALLFRTFQLRCGSKVDEYNGERRVKSTCYSAQPVDPIQRARQLMASINEWTN